MADDFLRMQRRLDALRDEIEREATLTPSIREILRDIRDDWTKAQTAVNTLVRTQTAQGLARGFLDQRQPYKSHAELSAMIDDGLLHHATFIQKSPWHLRFYKRLLAAMDPQPQRILEIGVKGGGSTAFWKALFPQAAVVGLDLKLRPWLRADPAPDGVIYREGDQADVGRLREIAAEHGPFDLIIDDGSHVAADQETTIRALLPRVRSGGFYVIEDIQTTEKKASSRPMDFGADIWADFTVAALQIMRHGATPPGAGAQLARDLKEWIAEVVIGRQVLAVRAKGQHEDR
jgi:cephalosporin hydroxylase